VTFILQYPWPEIVTWGCSLQFEHYW